MHQKVNDIKSFMDTGPYLSQISWSNADRLVILALGAIPVNLLHIIFFILNHSSRADSTEKTWSIGIILSHSFLMVFFIIFLSRNFEHQEERTFGWNSVNPVLNCSCFSGIRYPDYRY